MKPSLSFTWAVLASSALALTACGGGSSDPTPAPAPAPAPAANARSTSEAIARLDATGQLPQLDRSAALAGPDANGNGVRDDVEALIAAKPDASPQKAALRQTSASLTAATVVDTSSDAAVRAAAKKLNDAIGCIWSQYPADQADKAVEEMRKVTVNTRARFDAYMKYNAARSGAVVSLSKEVVCE
jgi:hypothetical protein